MVFYVNISYNKHNDVNLFVQEVLNIINKQ